MPNDPRPLLLAFLDADDARAKAASWPPESGWAKAREGHIAAHDPDSSLRLNAALRDIIERDPTPDAEGRDLFEEGYAAAVAGICSDLADALTPGWDR